MPFEFFEFFCKLFLSSNENSNYSYHSKILNILEFRLFQNPSYSYYCKVLAIMETDDIKGEQHWIACSRSCFRILAEFRNFEIGPMLTEAQVKYIQVEYS